MKTILRGIGLALILFAASTGAAQGFGCQGSCTVYCDSGATDYHYVTASACCGSILWSPCADGSNPYGAEWWPVTCGYAQIC